MRQAEIKIHDISAGILTEESSHQFSFQYHENYKGIPISLTIPLQNEAFQFERFPPFFDGLLPEGTQLEGLLKKNKIDKTDYFLQLITVGEDVVGAITIHPMSNE